MASPASNDVDSPFSCNCNIIIIWNKWSGGSYYDTPIMGLCVLGLHYKGIVILVYDNGNENKTISL